MIIFPRDRHIRKALCCTAVIYICIYVYVYVYVMLITRSNARRFYDIRFQGSEVILNSVVKDYFP